MMSAKFHYELNHLLNQSYMVWIPQWWHVASLEVRDYDHLIEYSLHFFFPDQASTALSCMWSLRESATLGVASNRRSSSLNALWKTTVAILCALVSSMGSLLGLLWRDAIVSLGSPFHFPHYVTIIVTYLMTNHKVHYEYIKRILVVVFFCTDLSC